MLLKSITTCKLFGTEADSVLDKLWLLLLLITAICIVETHMLQGGHITPKTRMVTGGLKEETRLELGYEEGRT